MTARTRRILGSTPVFLIALFLLFASALPKFLVPADSASAEFMRGIGAWDLRHLYALLEIVCAVLLLVPRTSTFGIVMTTGLLGGAIATHLTHTGFSTWSPLLPAAMIGMLAFSAWYRNPELKTRLLGRPVREDA